MWKAVFVLLLVLEALIFLNLERNGKKKLKDKEHSQTKG